MSCIGTAGHVDHGKSTLVTALTGIDPDRLAEEKARGMTIDLGFAWLTLPSGREVSIVDVPGHEGFIKNMLAGVGGIDVALLVVAADEGVMPQTDEHLAILDLLGIRTGVVALTKCDLVDADWLELVREEVSERLAPTSLANAPIIPCSAVTRDGLPEVLDALDTAIASAAGPRDQERPRLPVDRVFSVAGFGTVVTGTLLDGTMHVGQDIEILPRGLRGRVRGLQSHKHTVDSGLPGGRLAVNVSGVTKADLARGDVIGLPGQLRTTRALDARVRVISSSPRPLAHNAEIVVYAGASEVNARVLLLDGDLLEPGQSGWAQFRLAGPLAVLRGDRFIVRVPSPSATIAGGVVVEPVARRHRRHDTALLSRLEVLSQGDPEDIVLAVLNPQGSSHAGRAALLPSQYGARTRDELTALTTFSQRDVDGALDALASRAQIRQVGAYLFATSEWQRLRADSLRLLENYHRHYPLRQGMPREEWRARLGFSPRLSVDIMSALVAEGELAEISASGVNAPLDGASAGSGGALLRASGFAIELTDQQQQQVAAVLAQFRAEPFSPPTRQDVEDALGAELTVLLVTRGELVAMSDSILLGRTAYAEVVRRVVEHLRAHETLSVAQARDLLGTSRKYMLGIFEYLDGQRITQRRGDDRVLGSRATAALESALRPVADNR